MSLIFLFSCAEVPVNNSITTDYPNGQQPYYHYSPQTYYPQIAPGSKVYSNPYAIPPREYYPYGDFDQYYVMPSGYDSSEPDQTLEEREKSAQMINDKQ
ncbi:MAG: hypothetical protein V4694_05245 [Pseudomonadota bacterium]